MGHCLELELGESPWPINILKFNQLVHEMAPGDQLRVVLKDKCLKANLTLLLKSMADCRFDFYQTSSRLVLEVTKHEV